MLKLDSKMRYLVIGLFLVALLVVARLGGQTTNRAGAGLLGPSGSEERVALQGSEAAAAPLASPGNGLAVGRSVKNDTSIPLRDIKPVLRPSTRKEPDNENPGALGAVHIAQLDKVVQRTFGTLPGASMPSPATNFEGIDYPGVDCHCVPPDTNGDVGPRNYVQIVNTAFQVFDKRGNSLYGPATINTLFSGFGGVCETRDDGDPIVLYDPLADRWLVSQFTFTLPTYQCIAVSASGDPTGSWYRYAFQTSIRDFPDYPKFGVWPDGYYMTANIFKNGSTYAGPQPYVFERAKMLLGQPAAFQTTPDALGRTVAPILPSDLDGSTPPPAGAPDYFVGFGSPLPLYEYHVNWANPAGSTFGLVASLNVAGFTQLKCPAYRKCVSQPNTNDTLDGLSDRPMFRLAYRNFGTYTTMVVNHTVDAGSGVAAVRWYEIRNPGPGASVYQQGTYAPDSNSRWMGSMAMDRQGNIALGYSVSSSSVFPSIRYTGRLVGDPPGQLPQGEATLYAGTGSQVNSYNRWGDYSAMSVDPSDDCTFWYTNEYYQTTGSFNWKTRVGSFKFPGCHR